MSKFFNSNPSSSTSGETFAFQEKLPRLPIPPLEDTCRRYLKALEGLQEADEHETTKKAVNDFLKNEGPMIQEKLLEWSETKDRCVSTIIPPPPPSHP